MTYLQFLLIFLVPWIVLELVLLSRKKGEHGHALWGVSMMAVVAVLYTTPWDNYLVKHKIWWYGPERVLGTIGYVPIEEYAFFVLQTFMSGLFLYHLRPAFKRVEDAPTWVRPVGSFILALISLMGAWMLLGNDPQYRYLGLILAWAGPVILLQFAIGGHVLWNRRRVLLPILLVASLYLCMADALAISWGIWTISPEFTTGIMLAGLPLEEATFFFVTNIMVVQGLDLLWSFAEGWGKSPIARLPVLQRLRHKQGLSRLGR